MKKRYSALLLFIVCTTNQAMQQAKSRRLSLDSVGEVMEELYALVDQLPEADDPNQRISPDLVTKIRNGSLKADLVIKVLKNFAKQNNDGELVHYMQQFQDALHTTPLVKLPTSPSLNRIASPFEPIQEEDGE